MFETDDFRARLQTSISSAAAQSGMAEYETRIIDYLQGLASENEGILTEREMRKAVGERRGVSDALASADDLAREASSYARADNRKTLTLGDIQKAYQAKLCQIWPFCK